ncbi:MAG: DNA replication and repair protein RecF [Bacteroidaceae bacterium]|nr:DNA replication and repair protein RecF [Bacteroidaceae bacterium]
MYLERLFLMNYRSIAQADLQLSPKMNCLVGSNGMGKTNILDAIHYLSFCKSSLSFSDSQTIRHGAECMMLHGTYCSDFEERTGISCTLKQGCRKQFMRDRKEYRKFSDHIGLIPLVMISPDDMQLISGGSDERRRFMDIVISQYDKEYLGHLISYNKAMAQRGALLKMESQPDDDQFLVWETIMDSDAAFIYGRRREFIDKVSPLFQQIYSQIGADSEKVSLEYTSHIERGPLINALREWRTRERTIGYTLHGIHKDELEMTLGDYPIRREGSQGQGKSYLTALKLAQYLYLSEACGKRKPILLLDDLFDKLDSKRVEKILRLVSGEDFGQIFITDVNRDHIDGILKTINGDFRILNVEDGNVI